MKIVRNNFIPAKGFAAINIYNILFVRPYVKITDKLLNHEKIHTRQIIEVTIIALLLATLLFIMFGWWGAFILALLSYYLIYVIEWVIRLPFGDAYRNISFEREAFHNENNLDYRKTRKLFSFLKYTKKPVG